MRDNKDPFPAGFSSWVSTMSRYSFMLPVDVVQQLEVEAGQRLAAEQLKLAQEEERSESERRTRSRPQEIDLPRKSTFSDRVPPGYVRVLPRIIELRAQLTREISSIKVSDKDIAERREKLLVRLLNLGPDREFVLPGDNAVSIIAMEHEHPNFRAPLRLIRNRVAMAATLKKPVRIPPILLVGAPGVGKTYFTHCLAEALGVPCSSISFDQPTAGSQLRGSDKYWSNTESGVLFNQVCLGVAANPIVLLDELDKSASTRKGGHDLDPLAQLHGALEPQTASRMMDISTEIEFDASMVTYIATANSVAELSPAILSRFEIFHIQLPTPLERLDMATRMVSRALTRWDLPDFQVEQKALIVLSALTPRMIQRTLESAIAEAIVTTSSSIGEADIWRVLGLDGGNETVH